MTRLEMEVYLAQVEEREQYYLNLLERNALEFAQWESLRLAGEKVLCEQMSYLEIDALECLDITDNFLTWMYRQGLCARSVNLCDVEHECDILLHFRPTQTLIKQYWTQRTQRAEERALL